MLAGPGPLAGHWHQHGKALDSPALSSYVLRGRQLSWVLFLGIAVSSAAMAGPISQARCVALHQSLGVQNVLQQTAAASRVFQDGATSCCLPRVRGESCQSSRCFSVPLQKSLAGSKVLGLWKHESCPSSSASCDAPRSRRRGCQATQAEAQPSQEAVLPGPWFSPRLER